VQDPSMAQVWKDLFENHGCRVVEHPTAFNLVNPNSFIFLAFQNDMLGSFVRHGLTKPETESEALLQM